MFPADLLGEIEKSTEKDLAYDMYEIVLVQVCVSDPDGHWPQVQEKSVKEPNFLDLPALYIYNKYIYSNIFYKPNTLGQTSAIGCCRKAFQKCKNQLVEKTFGRNETLA
jgi:hypothetical protein